MVKVFFKGSRTVLPETAEKTPSLFICVAPQTGHWFMGGPLYIYIHTWPILIVSPSYEPPFLQCHSLLQIQAKPAPSNSPLLLYYI